MQERRLSFGSAAATYEAFRPDYPAQLPAVVLAYADQPVRTALEIGAGTGKATRLFATAGIAVTASDPDPEMLALLRSRVPDVSATIEASLETLPETGHRYDLVFVAAALHWTAPEGRWRCISTLLRPAGTFAAIGGAIALPDSALESLVDELSEPFIGPDSNPVPGTPGPTDEGARSAGERPALQWPGDERQASPLFTDAQQHVIERRITMSRSDYVGYLSTVSAYLILPDETRVELLSDILAALPQTLSVDANIVVHLARSAAGATD